MVSDWSWDFGFLLFVVLFLPFFAWYQWSWFLSNRFWLVVLGILSFLSVLAVVLLLVIRIRGGKSFWVSG